MLVVMLLLGLVAQTEAVTITRNAVDDTNGSTIGAVTGSESAATGAAATAPSVPVSWSSYRFTHWTLSTSPGTSYRDVWGRSQNPITITVPATSCTVTAHYLPSGRDSDNDAIPDWYEMEHFGNLARNAMDDGDGDGAPMITEYSAGTSPLFGNSQREGGVALVDSPLITCNLAGYAIYTIRSVPPGTVNQWYPAAPGTVVSVPDLSGYSSFGYWALDGVRQQDAWGRALTVFSFTMASADREAVAYLLTGDSDADGVPDAYEHRYYGTLGNNGSSDTDGDGITLLAEYTGNASPIYPNALQEGGVSWVESGLVSCGLQHEMDVRDPDGITIADGGSASFGDVAMGSPQSLTFTIKNVGGTSLTGLAVTIDGAHAAEFTLTASPTGPLAHNETTNFTVRFAPTAIGTRSAVLHVASNDSNENPYDISVTGTGVLAPTFADASGIGYTSNGFNATDLTLGPITLNYAPAAGTSLTLVRNTGLGFINGTFSNLAQGQAVALTYNGVTYRFVANYYGGSGNDVVLQWSNVRPMSWGWNTRGELGDNTTVQRQVPGRVEEFPALVGKTVIAMNTGAKRGVTLSSDGSLAAWGYNFNGQLGNNTNIDSHVPVPVDQTGVLSGKLVVAIASCQHTMALISDGTLAAWGYNDSGQVGDNSTTHRTVPVMVDASAGSALYQKTVVAMAAGTSHSVALCSDGTLAAWGEGTFGQLGDNGTAGSHVPVAVDQTGVLAGKTVIAVAAGSHHNLALCSDGTVVAWGYNGNGRLGDNSTTTRLAPVAVDQSGVLAGRTVIAVAAGGEHNLALCADGTVVAWGRNFAGQLGNNSTTDSWVPVAVSTSAGSALYGRTVVTVTAGNHHSMGLCSDGTLASWGTNYYGELGDDSTINRRVPVAVNTSALTAGERFVHGTSSTGATHSLGLVATPPRPEIAIQQTPGVELTDGHATIDFGAVTNGNSASIDFTIINSGDADLTGVAVTIDGTGAGVFTVTADPASTVASSGGSTTFTVRFAPTDAGVGTAMLHVTSNDFDEASFDAAVTGAGLNRTPTISDIGSTSTDEDVSTGAIGFTVDDLETAPGSLIMSGASSNPTLVPEANIVFGGSGANRTVTVTPAPNQNGSATITVTASDGQLTAQDNFTVAVAAIADAPTLADIGDSTTLEDNATGAIAFTVGDPETEAGLLTLSGTSSNTGLIPDSNIAFGGSGANRTVTITPVANMSGTATIAVTVSDGMLTAQDTFLVAVEAVNDAPTISDVMDVSTAENTAVGPVAFVVGDLETTPGLLILSGTSSNTGLVPDSNIAFGGSGANRTVTITPVANVIGSSTITIILSDGVTNSQDAFVLTVDSAGTVALGSSMIQVQEDVAGGVVNIPIVRTHGAAGDATVRITTSNGTATAAPPPAGDYGSRLNELVEIDEGQDLVNVPITIHNPPGTVESNETFTVTISDARIAHLGSPLTATVRIIDSVDGSLPTAPVITFPTANAILSDLANNAAQTTLTGTAADNKGIGSVKVKLNTGGFVDAVITVTGTNGTSANWSLPVTPLTGSNTITVQSFDTRGNASALVTRSFKVLRPLLVNVDTTQFGGVTTGFAGSTFREVGKSFTITATAKAPTTSPAFGGGLFTGWTLGGDDVALGDIDFTPQRIGVAASALEKNALTFTFREGLILTANFIANPYVAGVMGTYNGLIKANAALPDRTAPAVDGTLPGNSTEGHFTATVQNTGGFSGKLKIDGTELGVAGAFDHQGRARFGSARLLTLTVARTNKPSLFVKLDIGGPVGSVAPAGKITGQVSATEFKKSTIAAVSDVSADRAHFTGLAGGPIVPDDYLTVTGTAPSPTGRTDGNFTVVLPAVALNNQPQRIVDAGFTTGDYPQGDGIGTIKVSKAGLVTFTVTLADGTPPVTASGTLSEDLRVALFVPLYTAKGFLSALVKLNSGDTDSDLKTAAGGEVLWSRPTISTSHYYPHGWAEVIEVDFMGAKYAAVAGQGVMKAPDGADGGTEGDALQSVDAEGDGNITLTFSDGQLSESLIKNAHLTPGATMETVLEVPDPDPTFSLSITRSSGAISGSFTHTDDTVPTFKGTIYQKGPNAGAYGFFLTKQPVPIDYTGESGGVTIIGQP